MQVQLHMHIHVESHLSTAVTVTSLQLRITPSTLWYSIALRIELGPEIPISDAYSKVAWEKYNILKEKKMDFFFKCPKNFFLPVT